ncbi:MAG: FAD-dependent monooxygenase [Paracoccaceae bacterium]
MRVLERAPEIAEVGAGLQISPNGMRVLDALGLGQVARAAAIASRAVRLVDGPTGRDVLTLDLAGRLPGQPFLLMHRADLISILMDAARGAGIAIETCVEVLSVADAAEGVELTLADGRTDTAALVIGADGLHSRARAALNGDAAPFFTGQVAWRALVPAPEGTPPEARVYMGPGRHLVAYPLRDGRFLNLVGVEERAAWADEGWNHSDTPENFRNAFKGFAPDIRARLDDLDQVFLWGLFRHPVAARWHGQRLAILGDAAHPTLPFLAQGANLALEDAWTLAACLASDAPDRALPRYQALRRDRAVRVIDAATANARNYHLSEPARTIAHAALRLGGAVAPGAALKRYAWLWGHDVTAA